MFTKPEAPAHLSRIAKDWWAKITTEFDVSDSPGQLLLAKALEAFDRAEQARRTLAKEGIIVRDRFGQLHTHPAVTIERDSMHAMQRALTALDLDLEIAGRPGRKPAGWSKHATSPIRTRTQ